MTNYLFWPEPKFTNPEEDFLRIYLFREGRVKVEDIITKKSTPIELYVSDFWRKYGNNSESHVVGEPWNTLNKRFGEFLEVTFTGNLYKSIPLINLGAQESERFNAYMEDYDNQKMSFPLTSFNEIHSIYDKRNFGFEIYGDNIEKIIRDFLNENDLDAYDSFNEYGKHIGELQTE